MDFSTLLIFILTLCVLIISISKILYSARVNLFQPIVVSGAMFVVFFLLDIIYILLDNEDSFNLSGKTFYYGDYHLSIFIILISILSWYLGDFLGKSYYRVDKSYHSFYINTDERFRYLYTISIFILVMLVIQTFILIRFIKDFGGINFYFDHIADRALIFSDATFLYASIQATTVISAILIGYFISVIKKINLNWSFKVITFLLFVLVMILGILTGARANIFKSIVVILVTYNFFGRRLKLNLKLILSFIVLGLFFVIFAQITRNVETKDESMIEGLYNGIEISQVNNILILEQYDLMSNEGGSTLISGLFSIIPSFIYEIFEYEKPKGANAKFTELIWYERWSRSQSEVALGFLGEIALNFGLILVPVFCLLTGFLYRKIYNFMIIKRKLGVLGVILYIGVLWSIFQLLRGDLFNTTLNFFIYTIGCYMAFFLIKLSKVRKKVKTI